jgi:hypothetical protein
MKMRNGFVSNSSSSSFVVLGFQINGVSFSKRDYLNNVLGKDVVTTKLLEAKNDYEMDDEEALEDLWFTVMYENGDAWLHGHDDGVEGEVLGCYLVDGDREDGIEDGSAEVDDLSALAFEVRTKFNLPKDTPWRIYWGQRKC